MLLAELREQVLYYSRKMTQENLARARQGNVSALDRATGLVAVTPSAAEYADMTAADIVVIDQEGNIVEGRWLPTSEHPMHTLFYRRRPDIGAVLHCHPPFTSIFAATHETIPLVLAETASGVGHSIKVAPYESPGTVELGEACLETMGGGTAVVMGGHGLLTVGPDLPSAYSSAVSVEDNAFIVVYSRCMGAQPHIISDAEAAVLHARWLAKYRPTAYSK